MLKNNENTQQRGEAKHCIRATTMTYLDGVEYLARHRMSVSGNRSEASIRSYSRTSTEKRKEMSSLLSAKFSISVALENDRQSSTSSSIAPSSEKRPINQKLQQRTLDGRLDLNIFIPRFNMTAGIFSNGEDAEDAPRQRTGYVGNLYKNLTFTVINKVVSNKRLFSRIVLIII